MKGYTTILSGCLSLIAISANLSAFAGAISSAASIDNSWTIGGSALILQPALNDRFVYAIINTDNASANTINTTNEALNPNYSWGFDMFLRYNFNHDDRDLSASYMRFASSDTGNVSVPLASNYIYTNFYQTARGTNKTNVDAADILAGQSIALNDAVRIHGTLGVGYARLNIKNSIANDQGLGYIPNAANESYRVSENTFNGAGPKCGIDGEYMIHKSHFGLVGGVSAALLIGSQSVSNSNIVSAVAQGSNGNIYTPSTTTAITNINGNIGLRYHAKTHIPVNAEIGYKVYDYINDVSLAGVYLTLTATFS